MNSKPRKPFALFSLLALSLIASACSLLASSSSLPPEAETLAALDETQLAGTLSARRTASGAVEATNDASWTTRQTQTAQAQLSHPTLTPSPVESAFAPGSNPTAAPPLTLTPAPPNAPAESILILSPGPDSQITSPVTITGISDPTFEKRLSIQILDEAGNVIVSDGVTINANLGERGPFEAAIEFEPPAQPQHGRIIVFDLSPRDGHISHLASVPVTLLPAGAPADIKPGQEHPEDIVILSPAPQEIVGGGTVHVSGFAAPVFEQTLSVTVVDLIGAVVGSGTLTLQAEAGQPGRFESNLTYVVTEEQHGSIQVYATSPRDGGLIHLASVGVALRP